MNARRALILFLGLVGLLVVVTLWREDPRRRQAKQGERQVALPDAPQRRSSPRPPATTDAGTHSDEPDTRVSLPPGAVGELRPFRGRVIWADGGAVAGALVELRTSPLDGLTRYVVEDDGVVRSRAFTDEQGHFRVEWAPGSLWSLFVIQAVAVCGKVVRTPPLGDEITIVLKRQRTQLEIEVVRKQDGEPLVGANVEVRWRDTLVVMGGPTGDDGRFKLDWAVGGRAHVSVWPGQGERIIDHTVDCREGETNSARIEIGMGFTARGTVVADDSGAPVPGATVMLGVRQFDPQIQRSTDSEGKFVLDSLPWQERVSRTLSVVAPGFGSWQASVGHPVAEGGTQEFDVRLLRSATLRLRCVFPDGRPRPDIFVVAETHRLLPGERTIAGDYASARTDANGAVTLAGLPPGEWGKVTCWVAGAIALEIPLDAITASEVRELGDVVIHAPLTLSGTVRTAHGDPAAGSFAVLEPHHDEDTEFAALSSALIAPRLGARIDKHGRFRIRGVRPGEWDLLIHGGGHPRLLRVAIPVTAGKSVSGLKLRLPAPVALRGRVVDGAGAGVAGLSLEYLRAHPVAANLLESVTTDADGRFSIPGFTQQDEKVVLYVKGQAHEITPRDGPVEISLDR